MQKDITIVTAITPDYEEKFKTVLPTWKIKKQIFDLPLIIFTHGFNDTEKILLYAREYFDTKIIKWDMDKYDSKRELMLSSFVIGTSKFINTNYWIKLDCDSFFTDNSDIFCEEDFNYDIVGHKWRYTKPAKWLKELDQWAFSVNLPGDPISKRYIKIYN